MPAAPSREAFSFFHTLRVRWAEVDPQSIVFNGHYLTYADVAITEYFRALGIRYTDDLSRDGGDFFAIKTVLEYLAPLALTMNCRLAFAPLALAALA